ncbi:class I SAM-dependent methyltransferase [Shimia sp.]|uniref:class I SAM-dependent methyltransferase n=1 Tax=Shimia sp. TaxID=1954381 RepID=UPI003296811E
MEMNAQINEPQKAVYSEYVNRLLNVRGSQSEDASAADQLLFLRDQALARPNGTFLELGTWQGQATKVMLNALNGARGTLVSVDIEDCRDAGAGPNWQFVQSDSKDDATVLAHAPVLKDGIDLVYVDGLHTVAQVYAEIKAWFPLVRQGGMIVFDDVDPTPYMCGHRKDSARKEIANRAMATLLTAVFYENMDRLRMEMKLGSTGLAIWTKTSEIGSELRAYRPMTHPRHEHQLADLHDDLREHKPYKHTEADQVTLIPMDASQSPVGVKPCDSGQPVPFGRSPR